MKNTDFFLDNELMINNSYIKVLKIMDSGKNLLLVASISFVIALWVSGCGTTTVKREAGQVEMFRVVDKKFELVRPFTDGMTSLGSPVKRTNFTPQFGDMVQFETDVLTFQVHSVYIDSLPSTLTGSKDVVIFSEVWENATVGYNAPPLTSVVYIGRNQKIPGHLNFSGNLAYGPTAYKGHPLKIRFTVMVLQKEAGKEQSAVADVVSKYSSAIPVYGAFISPAAAVMRDLLRAQPDIIAFDFETTLLSHHPNKLQDTIPVPVTLQNDLDSAPLNKKGGVVKKRQNANTNTAQTSFENTFGWLQYGFYGLVETEKRTSTNLVANVGKQHLAVKQTTNPSKLRVYNPDDAYLLKGGWVLEKANDDATNKARDRVFSKYLIFSVTPRQIAQRDDVLQAASESNAALLQNIRQSEENVKGAIEAINKSAESITYALIKSRANSVANRIAQSEETLDGFNSKFESQWASLVSGFGVGWNDVAKSEIKTLKESVLNQYKSIYETLQETNETNVDLSDAIKHIALATDSLESLTVYYSEATHAVSKITNSLSIFRLKSAELTNGYKSIESEFSSLFGDLSNVNITDKNLEKAKNLHGSIKKLIDSHSVEQFQADITGAFNNGVLALQIGGRLGEAVFSAEKSTHAAFEDVKRLYEQNSSKSQQSTDLGVEGIRDIAKAMTEIADVKQRVDEIYKNVLVEKKSVAIFVDDIKSKMMEIQESARQLERIGILVGSIEVLNGKFKPYFN